MREGVWGGGGLLLGEREGEGGCMKDVQREGEGEVCACVGCKGERRVERRRYGRVGGVRE